MTRDDLRTRAHALLGRYWQRELAILCGVDRRTVRRWAAQATAKHRCKVPNYVEAILRGLEREKLSRK